MDNGTLLLLVIVVAAVGFALYFFIKKERTQKLQTRFGPEYKHTVERFGDRAKAETDLKQRTARVEKMQLRTIPEDERLRFADEWRHEQEYFVDNPAGAVDRADMLVNRVMLARGYPMAEFDQRAADISVDHPHVVKNYRSAHDIAMLSRDGRASTEDLRHAMVCYRELFEDLLDTRVKDHEEVRR
jgi:hypothetical protein